MSDCAGKPLQSFIIADKLISGKSNIESASSQTGIIPGVASGDTTNLGRAFPIQAGVLTSEATDQDYLIQKAGGSYTGEWVWKPVADTDYYGGYDNRRFWGYNSPIPATPGSDNCTVAYLYEYQRLVSFAINQANDNVQIRFLQDDADYMVWDSGPTFTLVNPVAHGHCSAQASTLDDGRLMLIVRTEGNAAPTIDFDVYHSIDGGSTFHLVSERIIDNFTTDNTFGTNDTDSQFRVGVSGDFIRLCYATGVGVLNTWLSRDRGITWQRITISPGGGDMNLGTSGDPDDPYPFDLVDVDDSGTFVICVINPGVGLETGTENATCTVDGLWGPSLAVSGVGHPADVKSINMVRTNNHIWQFSYWHDASPLPSGWTFRRSLLQNWQHFLPSYPNIGWSEVENPVQQGPTDNYPGRLGSCWAGNRIFFQGSCKRQSTGIDRNYALSWFHGGWDTRSVGRSHPVVRLDQTVGGLAGARYLTTRCWNGFVGDFGTSNIFTPTLVGTGAINVNVQRARFGATSAGDQAYAEIPNGGGTDWGVGGGDGCMWGFTCRVPVGAGDVTGALTLANDFLGARVRSSATGGYRTDTVRISDTSIRLISHDSGGTPTSDTITGLDLTVWNEIRVSMQQNPITLQLESQVAIYNTSTQVWRVGNSIVRQLFVAAPTTYPIRMGCMEPALLTLVPYTMDMTDFWIIDKIPDSVRIVDTVNPDDLFGHGMSPNSTQTQYGMLVAWSGAGAAIDDSFTGLVNYSYPAESTLTDCPRIQWRSNPTRFTDQLIITHNIFSGANWTNPGVAVTVITPNVVTDPYGVVNSADNINITAGVVLTPILRHLATTTEGAGYTVSFWAKTNLGTTVLPISVGVSDGVVVTPYTALDSTWTFFELSAIAGPSGHVDIYLCPFIGSPWNISFYDFRVSPQPYVIYDANSTTPADNQLRKFVHTAAATFGSNVRKWLIDYSDASNFVGSSTVDTIDATLFDSGITPLVVRAVDGNQIGFSDNSRVIRGSLLGKFIRFVSGESTQTDDYTTWKVIDHTMPNDIVVETYQPAGNPETQGVAVDDEFVVFDSKAAVYYGEARGPFRYVRLRAQDEQVAGLGPTVTGSPFQLGTSMIGRHIQIDVPLDWSFTDNEQPNVTTYRTRGAVTWGYNEGPPQRTITARLVGDVERYRDVIRYFERYLQYETRALALVLDDEAVDSNSSAEAPNGPEKWLLLVRLVSGNEQENAAWYFDDNGVLRVAGDLSLTFNEEV